MPGTKLSFKEAANQQSGTLTVTSGTHSATLTLNGNYTASNFKLASDGHGGTTITDPSTPSHSSHTTAGNHATGNAGGVSGSGHIVDLSLLTQYAAASFGTSSDGHGGVHIRDPVGSSVSPVLAAHG